MENGARQVWGNVRLSRAGTTIFDGAEAFQSVRRGSPRSLFQSLSRLLMIVGETRTTGLEARSWPLEANPKLFALATRAHADLIREGSEIPDLGELVAKVRGAYPSEVALALDDLKLPYSVRSAHPSTSVYSVELHPLYYEWYFTRATAESLASLAPSRANVLCIGTPTVAAAFARSGRYIQLIDKSPFVKERFPELTHAGTRTIGIEDVRPGFDEPDFIIFDAPWYYWDIRTWLLCAHGLSRAGTIVLFSLPPENIRASAEAERARLLRLARSIGEVTVAEGALVYETPLFEKEALRVTEIEGIGDWRVGDLVRLRVTSAESRYRALVRRTRSLRAEREDHWWTHRVGSQVVKLRVRRTHVSNQVVTAIAGCPNNILTSVSKRDPRRPKVGVWTSRNRVASIGRPDDVRKILNAIERGKPFEIALSEAAARGVMIDEPSAERLRQVIDV